MKDWLRFTFKCNHNEGQHYCNGKHEYIIDDVEEFRMKCLLLHLMIYKYKMTVNTEIINEIYSKFIKHVYDEFQKNSHEKWHHFMNIDIGAELYQSFREKEFGEI